MSECNYNGWKNHATWAMNLYLSESWRESAQEFYDTSRGTVSLSRREEATITLAKAIKEQAEDDFPELPQPWHDLIRGAFDTVGWYELADGVMSSTVVEGDL